MNNIHGTCSNCGGCVTTPTMWGGPTPPVPRCEKCGATMRNPYGATLPMNPPQDFRDFPRESQQEYFGIKKKD